MTEDANTEALRLVEQTHCESAIDTPLTADQIEGMYHFTLDEIVRLIALACASQAQPPAGWGAMLAAYDDEQRGEVDCAAIDAAIAAAPSPTGEKE